MKIGNHAHTSPPATPVATAAASGSAATATGAADVAGSAAASSQADASAKIALSNTASTLLSNGSTAEFDAEKVARIAHSIDKGTFKINPEAIADKLIANAQELLSSVKR